MSKTSIGIIIGAVTLIIGFYVYTTSFIGEKKVVEQIEKNEETELIEKTEAQNTDEPEENKEMESQLEKEFPMSMREGHVQNTIHHMSHSKVHADQKWGHLEPTQERIDRLLDVVEKNQDKYKHSTLYISILEKWQKGDFSGAVSDHNRIWDLQGGNTGKATRLLSEAEEEAYRKKHFK